MIYSIWSLSLKIWSWGFFVCKNLVEISSKRPKWKFVRECSVYGKQFWLHQSYDFSNRVLPVRNIKSENASSWLHAGLRNLSDCLIFSFKPGWSIESYELRVAGIEKNSVSPLRLGGYYYFRSATMKRRAFIRTLLLSAGSLIIGSHNLIASALDKNTIKILMLYK